MIEKTSQTNNKNKSKNISARKASNAQNKNLAQPNHAPQVQSKPTTQTRTQSKPTPQTNEERAQTHTKASSGETLQRFPLPLRRDHLKIPPPLRRESPLIPPSLAENSPKDSPSLAENSPKDSPSLAEGVRGWVDLNSNPLSHFETHTQEKPTAQTHAPQTKASAKAHLKPTSRTRTKPTPQTNKKREQTHAPQTHAPTQASEQTNEGRAQSHAKQKPQTLAHTQAQHAMHTRAQAHARHALQEMPTQAQLKPTTHAQEKREQTHLKHDTQTRTQSKPTAQSNSKTHYERSRAKIALIYALCVVAVIFIALFALSVGRYELSLSEILTLLSGGETEDSNAHFVLLDFRAPRIVLGIVMGAALSMAGCAFQNLFSNPLATADILGVTSASSFGAVLALMLGLGMLGVFGFGFVFGILSLLLVLAVSYSRFVPLQPITMILSGIIISALFSSLVSLVKYLADPQDTLPSITYWLLGSLSRVWSGELLIGIVAVCVGCALLFILRWKLNILSLSEEEAKSLGINLNALRSVVIISCTLIVSVSVGLCGIIGWVGLLVPHIARLLVGSESSRLLPLSAILGAGFVVVIDTLSRSISSNEIPISILTAIIGAPFFIYILQKNKGGVKL